MEAAKPVVVEFKGLRPGSQFVPGLYQLLDVYPLHSTWMMARCGLAGQPNPLAEQQWECPLNPEQARSVEAMLEGGPVAVQLVVLPPDDHELNTVARSRYRAEFNPDPSAWRP
jgi:hypothetical protein